MPRLDADLLRAYAPLVTLIVLTLVVGAAAPGFLEPSTLVLLAADTATLFIMAAGITFIVILGGIDLSVQSVASLASVVMAVTLPTLGIWCVPLALAVGAFCGLVSGLAYVRLRIPSFIATLAVSGIASAAALIFSGTRSVPMDPTQRATTFAWITGETLGLPNAIVIALLVLVICLFIERYTTFGRRSIAVGAGEAAALAAGIRVGQVKVLALVISGTLAALAGVILAARLASGSPSLANEFLLPAVAAVCVGGTALTGGVGSVARTLVGALIVSVVRIGMTFVGVDVFAQQIVFGAVLILAVAVTIDRSKIPVVK
ncbi:MAG: ABC transporter permease [Geminicoccaceae bacterium]